MSTFKVSHDGAGLIFEPVFKVGDRVRSKLTGVHYTVRHTDTNGRTMLLNDLHGCERHGWSPMTHYELVTAPHQFKVGDRVRSKFGTLRETYTVVFVAGDGRLRMDGTVGWSDPRNFELVTEPHQFKVGDRVRSKTSDSRYTIEKIDGDQIKFEGLEYWYHSNLFELVTTQPCVVPFNSKPATLKTRRTVVPGNYGIVTVDQLPHCQIQITPCYPTVDELREAAHILNQIAEIIEENEK